MVLVDTTVWIDLLRGRDTPGVQRLRQLLARGLAAVTPVVVQELVQGASTPANGDVLRDHFTALPMLTPDNAALTGARAGLLYARCRWQGITPRSPHDCLIAQTALEHGVALLHDDRDFDLMASVESSLVLMRD